MRNKKLLRGLAAMTAALALALTGCSGGGSGTGASADTDKKVLKLGHIAAEGTAYDNLAKDFKKRIEASSNGRIEVQIYPAGQLGVDRELMESMQLGNVDMTVITASDINQFVPEMAVQDLPYVFKDWDHVWAFLKSDTAKDLYSLTDSANMKTLGFMPRGFRNVTNNTKPINTPEDLQGMKLRVAESEVYIDTFKALGANAQAMAWGEVFTALQQGTVDGHENTVITIRDYKINEVQKYLSMTQHFFAFAALQMSSKTFDSLSAEDQKLVVTAANEAVLAIGQDQQKNEASVLEELKTKGMEINTIDNLQPFADKVKPVIDNYGKTHDLKYFNAIQELK